MAAVDLITLGCRLNTYESEVMRGHALAAGLDDVVIVNTCAVTSAAESDARQAIRRARREKPTAKIIVTGCSAQIKGADYAAMSEVDHVIGNDLKLQAATFQNLGTTKLLVNDIQTVRHTAGQLADNLVGGFEGRARAYLQVQNGCDHRCTFCIIPYGRGPSRSVPIAEIISEVQKLVASGYREVVLTGVDVTSYGPDLPGAPTFGQMISQVLAAVPGLPRLRLSSLDPVEIDDELWRLIAEEPRLMPHLHMSLQAGDDMILKRMKRRHLRADAIAMAARARRYRPEITFGADLITGFPTETEEMFQNTLAIVDECDLTWLHVFPYSEREGTPAARMPPVEPQVRKERANRLRAKGDEKVRAYYAAQVGCTEMVLMEKGNIGRTPAFGEVRMDRDYAPGTMLLTKLVSAAATHATGAAV